MSQKCSKNELQRGNLCRHFLKLQDHTQQRTFSTPKKINHNKTSQISKASDSVSITEVNAYYGVDF